MTKRNINSFDLFGGDSLSEGQNFSDFFDERSKSVTHENRLQENVYSSEKTQNSTEIEEN